MKLKRIVLGLSVVVVTILACQKEASKELVAPPVTPPSTDTTIAARPDSTAIGTPDSTLTTTPTDTTKAPVLTDTTKTPAPPDTVVVQPPVRPTPVDTTTTTTPPPTPTDTTTVPPPPPVHTDTTQTTPPPQTPTDTAQTTPAAPQPTAIKLRNPGFEQWFYGWTKETTYTGKYGFSAVGGAATTGLRGLNFYAAQKTHWVGAPQETPWNGRVYQTVSGLKDGTYIFKAAADAVGDGMYLFADGGTGMVKVLIKSDTNEINSLEFEVTGGVARFGFICIDAGGTQKYAPYFHADNVQLLKK